MPDEMTTDHSPIIWTPPPVCASCGCDIGPSDPVRIWSRIMVDDEEAGRSGRQRVWPRTYLHTGGGTAAELAVDFPWPRDARRIVHMDRDDCQLALFRRLIERFERSLSRIDVNHRDGLPTTWKEANHA